ncbi:MAG: helix-turn-helix transcriptional regulator [Spirochaetaceae bacterium]|nr:helix-turn-helix transcriptional regulator [Spirochaetaceae bacterium]
MNAVANFVKVQRKKAGLTQEEFALRCGVGLRFIRDLEQGKTSCRMDKVNQVLSMFDCHLVPQKIQK